MQRYSAAGSAPESWPNGSFAGYAWKKKRVDWLAYDQLHTYWNASVGGKDPAAAYRRYVKAGMEAPDDPFKTELREWVFGSEDFLRRMIQLADGDGVVRQQSISRRLLLSIMNTVVRNDELWRERSKGGAS